MDTSFVDRIPIHIRDHLNNPTQRLQIILLAFSFLLNVVGLLILVFDDASALTVTFSLGTFLLAAFLMRQPSGDVVRIETRVFLSQRTLHSVVLLLLALNNILVYWLKSTEDTAAITEATIILLWLLALYFAAIGVWGYFETQARLLATHSMQSEVMAQTVHSS